MTVIEYDKTCLVRNILKLIYLYAIQHLLNEGLHKKTICTIIVKFIIAILKVF